jgi:hypothetical protein
VSSSIALQVALREARVALWGLVERNFRITENLPAPAHSGTYKTMQSTDPQIFLEEPVDFRNHPGSSISRFLKLQTIHLNLLTAIFLDTCI